ncbi:uncharacterized protein LOC119088213 [Peromyscus leucopus]|uniref:uncharacterized protein LOC119088213 n=1 Tax=Peromyscus leucopus TaxID=10041 RepID=UPI0018849EBA|nr:uncharacterized protein LOC119088213 [Peromyscus leucopus]
MGITSLGARPGSPGDPTRNPKVQRFLDFYRSCSLFVQSVSSQLATGNGKDVQETASNNNVIVKRRRWATFCSAEWPTFNVGWPAGGTLDAATIHRVEEIVSRPCSGHPDQVPYIVTWRGLIDREGGPLPWVKPFLPPQQVPGTQVLATRPKSSQAGQEMERRPTAVFQGGPLKQNSFHLPILPSPGPSYSAYGGSPGASAVES